MKFKHTPGPWVAKENYYSDAVVVVDSRGFQIVEAINIPVLLDYENKLGIPHWSDKPGESYLELEPEEEAANARLIAAAPELLEALIALSDGENEHRLQNARAVIAKATGEST